MVLGRVFSAANQATPGAVQTSRTGLRRSGPVTVSAHRANSIVHAGSGVEPGPGARWGPGSNPQATHRGTTTNPPPAAVSTDGQGFQALAAIGVGSARAGNPVSARAPSRRRGQFATPCSRRLGSSLVTLRPSPSTRTRGWLSSAESVWLRSWITRARRRAFGRRWRTGVRGRPENLQARRPQRATPRRKRGGGRADWFRSRRGRYPCHERGAPRFLLPRSGRRRRRQALRAGAGVRSLDRTPNRK